MPTYVLEFTEALAAEIPMPETDDAARAREIAVNHLVNEFRQSIELRPMSGPRDAYVTFDPAGWLFFAVNCRNKIGASQCIAVNLQTGESRSVGAISE